jgi:DNA repair exonuclease SbcCD nuclease subunit
MKSVLFTDIHFGRKQNSDIHNTDCVNFVKFMVDYINQHQDIDNIIFLGDWFENRSSVNILTLNYSYTAAGIINSLNIPVYFIVGNHDLYTRHNRDVFSTIFFHEFDNFHVIRENTVIKDIGNGILLSPFLFHNEYEHLQKYKNIPVWFGHYEFNGFIVTGDSVRYSGGPEPTNFKKIREFFQAIFTSAKNQII